MLVQASILVGLCLHVGAFYVNYYPQAEKVETFKMSRDRGSSLHAKYSLSMSRPPLKILQVVCDGVGSSN